MHRIIILSILVVSSLNLMAQCPTGPVFLTTQAQVDAFVIDYPFCTELDQSLRIEGSDIIDLNGLFKLTALKNGVLFINNVNLPNLFGLESITRIEGGMAVLGNSILPNFLGLNNLEYISGELQIESNDALTSFNGLTKLDSIIGQLFIYNNIKLSNLTAFNNLLHIASNLIISNNPLLSACHVTGICNYISIPNGVVLIENNSSGCNSLAEVEAACSNCGQINIYSGPAVGIWNNAPNWNLNKIPTTCHVVNINTGVQVVLQAGNTGEAQTIEIENGARLDIMNSATLEIIPD